MKVIFVNLIIIFSLFTFSCKNDNTDILDRLYLMDQDESFNGVIEDDETYRQLKKDISKYQKIIDEKVNSAEKLGTYYKLLGIKYTDYSMYDLALEAYEQALEIYPENPNVLYYAGVCSARLSKTAGNESEEIELITNAVRYYQASISINNRHSASMYGLAVLYIYELDQPQLAIELLETYNNIQKSSMRGRFLLASAYYSSGYTNEALDLYNEIIQKSDDNNEVESAYENRNIILGGDSHD